MQGTRDDATGLAAAKVLVGLGVGSGVLVGSVVGNGVLVGNDVLVATLVGITAADG
jgi:hypothetical protein